ncbi:MAG: hypothetical protein ACOYER_10045 [Limnochordia bacterium]
MTSSPTKPASTRIGSTSRFLSSPGCAKTGTPPASRIS